MDTPADGERRVELRGENGEPAKAHEKLRRVRELEPVIDRVLALDDVAEAHALIEGRQVFGKLVLVPSADDVPSTARET